jgi:hypothetical protein
MGFLLGFLFSFFLVGFFFGGGGVGGWVALNVDSRQVAEGYKQKHNQSESSWCFSSKCLKINVQCYRADFLAAFISNNYYSRQSIGIVHSPKYPTRKLFTMTDPANKSGRWFNRCLLILFSCFLF